jgi:hypothetical protein
LERSQKKVIKRNRSEKVRKCGEEEKEMNNTKRRRKRKNEKR